MPPRPKTPKSGLRSVGSHNILLTEAESHCFYVARDYQRKSLRRALLPVEIDRWRADFARLGWSRNPLVLAIQVLLLTLALVPMTIWLLLKCCGRWIAFPFRYLRTFVVPKDLRAPGEKTLVGIHNAFHRYFDLGASEYIACLNDWIKILYGEEKSQQFNLDNAIKVQLSQQEQKNNLANLELNDAMRSLVAISREKLSKQLGHYGQSQHLY